MRDKKGKAKEKKEVRDKKMRNLKYFLPLVVVITAVLLAFSVPADAKGIGGYAGNHPLAIYEHDTINGGLVFETVTDGSAYMKLQAAPEFPWVPRPSLTQDITITIPDGATVKMARLYNYYCWSTSDNNDDNNPGMPAEADIWFNGVKKVCKHGLADGLANRNSLSNPIDHGNGVIHYWDTKGQNYTSKIWDDPSGAFAWDVTDMVTESGTYTAKIQNNDSTPTAGLPGKPYASWERFATFGFGLLVVYEKESMPEIKYWVAEGCDYLMAQSWETAEDATTSATFGGVSGATDANQTTVWTHTEGGLATPPQNMMYFNSDEIGPSTAVSDQAIGVNYFDVTAKFQSDQNVLEFQDRDDDSCVHNAFLVVEYKPDLNITEKFETSEDGTYTVTYTVKNIGGASAGASTTSIKIDGTEEETDPVPELAAGASHTKTLDPFTMSGDSDTIRVCADKDEVVSESNEENNCLENEFEMPTPTPTPTPGEPVSTATGTGTAYFDSGSGSIGDLKAVSLPEKGKPDLQFTHGFFSFNITGLTPGETVTVTITLPSNVPVGTQYWKYGPTLDNTTDHWYQIPIGSDDGDNIITITIMDGGTGDHDLTANGEIVDPGGPGTPPPLPVQEFSPTGLLALIAVLSVVLAAVMRKRRRE